MAFTFGATAASTFIAGCSAAPFVKIDIGFDVVFRAGLLGFDCLPLASVYCLHNPDTGVSITDSYKAELGLGQGLGRLQFFRVGEIIFLS